MEEHHAGTYVCRANNSESLVERTTVLVVKGVVPRFAQAPLSYVQLPTIEDAYLKLDLEISFKPEAANGRDL